MLHCACSRQIDIARAALQSQQSVDVEDELAAYMSAIAHKAKREEVAKMERALEDRHKDET